MFTYLLKRIRSWLISLQKAEEHPRQEEQGSLTGRLKTDVAFFKEQIGHSNDVLFRDLQLGKEIRRNACLIFVDGLVKQEVINESIMEPLLLFSRHEEEQGDDLQAIINRLVAVGDVQTDKKLSDLLDACLSGDTLLLVEGMAEALVISTKGWDRRGVEKPQNESVVRGPREGFTESLRTNTALLRRKIKTPKLTFEPMKIGRNTHTRICLAFIQGLAKESLLQEVRNRLKKIDIDAVLESGYLEEFIEEAPFSVFSTVGYTEKPDVAAAKILEGRVGILVDGTPFVLTVPLLLVEHFHTAEDYYVRPIIASALRILRYVSFFISVLAPGLYVALTTFHQELIPTPLLVSMAAAREGVPFPAVVEAGLMMLTFEILREGGLRLPSPIGQAMSIVGALVMGEAAVSAGLIGAPMVILIAITAVSSFVVPPLMDTGAILRFVFLILSSIMGGVSIVIGALMLLLHVSSLQSFGYPFMAPLAPYFAQDAKDAVLRFPLWMQLTRPRHMAKQNQTRQQFNVPEALKSRKEK